MSSTASTALADYLAAGGLPAGEIKTSQQLREDLIASGYGPPTQDTMLKHCRQQLREVKLRDFDKKMGFTRHTTSQAAIEWVFERVGRGWVQAALAVVPHLTSLLTHHSWTASLAAAGCSRT